MTCNYRNINVIKSVKIKTSHLIHEPQKKTIFPVFGLVFLRDSNCHNNPLFIRFSFSINYTHPIFRTIITTLTTPPYLFTFSGKKEKPNFPSNQTAASTKCMRNKNVLLFPFDFCFLGCWHKDIEEPRQLSSLKSKELCLYIKYNCDANPLKVMTVTMIQV